MTTVHIGTTQARAWIASPGDPIGNDILSQHALVIADGDDCIVVEGHLADVLSLVDEIEQRANEARAYQETATYTVCGVRDENGDLHVAGVFLGKHTCVDDSPIWVDSEFARWCDTFQAASVEDAEAQAHAQCSEEEI